MPREDNALIEAVERADGVVLSTTEVDERGESNVFGGEDVRRADRRPGRQHRDPGRPRRGVCGASRSPSTGWSSFAVAAVEAATGRPVAPRRDAGGRTRPLDRLPRPAGDDRSPSPSRRCCAARCPPDAFRDKIVVVGASAPSLQDFHATPVGDGHEMPGAEIQANAIWTVEHGFPLKSGPRRSLNVALIVLFGLVAPGRRSCGCGRCSPSRSRSSLGLLFLVCAQLAFEAGLDPRRRLPARPRSSSPPSARWRSLPDHRLRAPAGPRHLRPLRPRAGRRRRARRAPTRTCGSPACGARGPCCSATCAASPASPSRSRRTR